MARVVAGVVVIIIKLLVLPIRIASLGLKLGGGFKIRVIVREYKDRGRVNKKKSKKKVKERKARRVLGRLIN